MLNALRDENERYLRLQEDSEECVRSRDELLVMGKVSKDDKIKLLEARVSLLEAEVLLKDELLNALRTENERYLRLQEDSEECVRSRDELVVKVSKLESEFKAIPAWIRKLFK